MATADPSIPIRNAARAALQPLGFRQKGRSRIWLQDHGYWLAVVEFQPSNWAKGAYLNVAVHWLWSPPTPDAQYALSFDYGGRISSFVEWTDNDQFNSSAEELAALAAEEAGRLRSTMSSIEAISKVLVAREAENEAAGRGGYWDAFHAGVASGLAGDWTSSSSLLKTAAAASVPPSWGLPDAAASILKFVGDVTSFRAAVSDLIERRRTGLGLSAEFNHGALGGESATLSN